MRIEKRDGSDERKILTAMIVSRSVLSRITTKWDGKLFKSKWSNLVGNWCIKFFKRFDDAPAKSIEGLFEKWASKTEDNKTIDLIEKFLAGLSSAYDGGDINTNYIVDLAGSYFNRVGVRKLVTSVEASLDNGDLEEGLQTVENFKKIEIGSKMAVDVMQDDEALRAAFEAQKEALIRFPGDLGKFFGNSFCRDSLIAFLGPEKRGKTWWLLDVAWRAMLQRRRVALFEVGDMSQDQVMQRLVVRASRQPLRGSKIKYPTHIERKKKDQYANCELVEKKFKTELTWQAAKKARDKICKTRIKSKNPYLKLSCHPNSTISVAGIEAELASWELNEGWVPDVIVIDYADILHMPGGGDDERSKINHAWMALRALSQKLHCCVVTATQADAASYTQYIIRRSNFSGDKRKLAHVTGMIGINQTAEEKEDQIQRLNWVVLREREFSENRCVHVAGCLAIGNPAVKSTL